MPNGVLIDRDKARTQETTVSGNRDIVCLTLVPNFVLVFDKLEQELVSDRCFQFWNSHVVIDKHKPNRPY